MLCARRACNALLPSKSAEMRALRPGRMRRRRTARVAHVGVIVARVVRLIEPARIVKRTVPEHGCERSRLVSTIRLWPRMRRDDTLIRRRRGVRSAIAPLGARPERVASTSGSDARINCSRTLPIARCGP